MSGEMTNRLPTAGWQCCRGDCGQFGMTPAHFPDGRWRGFCVSANGETEARNDETGAVNGETKSVNDETKAVNAETII